MGRCADCALRRMTSVRQPARLGHVLPELPNDTNGANDTNLLRARWALLAQAQKQSLCGCRGGIDTHGADSCHSCLYSCHSAVPAVRGSWRDELIPPTSDRSA